eukprot:TRINITY_DN10749_c0_g1_i1.p1 TRINITY_DN10749_c0_g1~~TRINITY_DN10749_c0_g1_i1.p1  ORF type:complete len:425 (-),score=88.91 TRINITY_DN10749_c0_g1_i1:42-1316(-)
MSTRRKSRRQREESRKVKHASIDIRQLSSIKKMKDRKGSSSRNSVKMKKSHSNVRIEVRPEREEREDSQRGRKRSGKSKKKPRRSVIALGGSMNVLDRSRRDRESARDKGESGKDKDRYRDKERVSARRVSARRGNEKEISRLNEIINELRMENESLKVENQMFRDKFQKMKEIYADVAGNPSSKNKKQKARNDFESLLSDDETASHRKKRRKDSSSRKDKEDGSKNEKSRRKKRRKSRREKKERHLRVKQHRHASSISHSMQENNAASEITFQSNTALYFGVPLSQIEVDDDNIPSFMRGIIGELLLRGLDSEGILRISGSASDINKLQNEIENGEHPKFEKESPNTLAGLLKKYFRSLPEPMIPHLSNSQIPFIMEDLKSGERDEASVVEDIKEVVYSLPQPNLSILLYLCKFLHEVWETQK